MYGKPCNHNPYGSLQVVYQLQGHVPKKWYICNFYDFLYTGKWFILKYML